MWRYVVTKKYVVEWDIGIYLSFTYSSLAECL